MPRAARSVLRRVASFDSGIHWAPPAHSEDLITKTSPATIPAIRDLTRFAEHDRVSILFRDRWTLSNLNRRDGVTTLRSTELNGHVNHNDIIGQPLGRLAVPTSKGSSVIVEYPSLEKYISETPRHVTPIYAKYASSIVDLLDIHVSPPTSHSQPLHILDAGTGHGSMAIHLARAIATANPPPPESELPEYKPVKSIPNDDSSHTKMQAHLLQTWAAYRETRKAVVHTVENVKMNRFHGEGVVRGFRQGLYWPHVDFYHTDVSTWLQDQYSRRGPFLTYATLDLPDVHAELHATSQALLPDGKLCVFVPSISQIAACQHLIEAEGIQLRQLKVVELGQGISTGRDWDVRFVTPRARDKRHDPPSDDPSEDDDLKMEVFGDNDGTGQPADEAPQSNNNGKVPICRPMVGLRIEGGGFVGVWQKKHREPAVASAVTPSFAGSRLVPVTELPAANGVAPENDGLSRSVPTSAATENSNQARTTPRIPGSRSVVLGDMNEAEAENTDVNSALLPISDGDLLRDSSSPQKDEFKESVAEVERLKAMKFRDIYAMSPSVTPRDIIRYINVKTGVNGSGRAYLANQPNHHEPYLPEVARSIEISGWCTIRLASSLSAIVSLRAARVLTEEPQKRAKNDFRAGLLDDAKRVAELARRTYCQHLSRALVLEANAHFYSLSVFPTEKAFLQYAQGVVPRESLRIVMATPSWSKHMDPTGLPVALPSRPRSGSSASTSKQDQSKPAESQAAFWPQDGDPFVELTMNTGDEEEGV